MRLAISLIMMCLPLIATRALGEPNDVCTSNQIDATTYTVECVHRSNWCDGSGIWRTATCNEGDAMLFGGCLSDSNYAVGSFTPKYTANAWSCFFLRFTDDRNCYWNNKTRVYCRVTSR